MVDKGLISASRVDGLTMYEPAAEKVSTIASLTGDFLRRVLEYSGPVPLSAFTGSTLLSDEEAARLKALIDDDEEAP